MDAGKVKVYNENNFTNVSEYDLSWELVENGLVIENGKIEDADVAPLTEGTLNVPFTMPKNPAAGNEYYLNISAALKETTDWADAGHELSWAQLAVPVEVAQAQRVISDKAVAVTETDEAYEVAGEAFSFQIRKADGIMENYIYEEELLVEEGPAPNFWRGKVENDKNSFDGNWENVEKNITVESIVAEIDEETGLNVITANLVFPDAGRTSMVDFESIRVYSKALNAEEVAGQYQQTPAIGPDDEAVELWVDFDSFEVEVELPPQPTPDPVIADDKSKNNLDSILPVTAQVVDGERAESAVKGYFSIEDPENIVNEAMTGGNPFTVSSKVYVPASVVSNTTGIFEGNQKHNMIASIGDNSFAYRVFYNKSSGAVRIDAFISDGSDWNQISADITEEFYDKWHTIAVSYDGTVLTLFIDGAVAAVSEGEITANIYNSKDAFSIGHEPQKTTRKSELTFEEVIVFNEAMDEEALNANHLATDDNVVLWMDFEPAEETTPVSEIFPDVEAGAWYEEVVQYVYDEGIIVGDGDVFAPNDATTRAMVAVILYRLAGSPEVTEADYAEYNKFTDLPAEHLWYSDAVAWAVDRGIIKGAEATDSAGNTYYDLLPQGDATRAQFARVLHRYLGGATE